MTADSTPDIGLAALLLRRAELTPHRKAVTFEGTTRTFGGLADRARRIAGALLEGGIQAGDRVGYLGVNHSAFLEALYGTAAMGGVFVPLNFRLTGDELTYIVNDAGIKTLFVDDALHPTIAKVRSNLCCSTYIDVESRHEDVESRHESDGFLEEIIKDSEPLMDPHNAAQDDDLLIMYTSGTTGLPKGAVLTHANLYWNFVNTMMSFNFLEEDVTLVAAPLFHIGGLNVTTLGTINVGGHAIIHRSFDPGQALADIEGYKVTTMFGAPAMYQFMALNENWQATDLSSLRGLICGAAPVPEPLIKEYSERGITFCQGYGMTELSPLALILSGEFSAVKIGSTGKPAMFTEVRVVDEGNRPVEAGARGEVVVRGPNVMKGYWNNPDATAATIDADGWLHSGDIAYVDEEGFFYICDRLKDMVISGGENVYPAEVESILVGHDAIAEVAVIGVPDEKWGEAVTAIAALHEGKSLSLEELREFATGHLARYKLPLHLHIVDELPRNAAGKILKFELRDRFE
ncbi:MAG: long-chain fatty acid--CoA ligase [Pseudomonadales bacterium]|jgi:fatty-acyl-CoA synthase|nr:long-chain fatty acid--CoA ligase [Pseudomonadales bacterium]MDP7594857.1 long-chain fatty acid--CoA ligase [Pseudomonadales bacterium]HJN50235.1 long-chain fatty acid--CoA ligase [Pseudomonadales bacterium]|tara:strand:- start:931 stop:2484 length:1554 start_codon:yes stop_codon:yes gene_type:complete